MDRLNIEIQRLYSCSVSVCLYGTNRRQSRVVSKCERFQKSLVHYERHRQTVGQTPRARNLRAHTEAKETCTHSFYTAPQGTIYHITVIKGIVLDFE